MDRVVQRIQRVRSERADSYVLSADRRDRVTGLIRVTPIHGPPDCEAIVIAVSGMGCPLPGS